MATRLLKNPRLVHSVNGLRGDVLIVGSAGILNSSAGDETDKAITVHASKAYADAQAAAAQAAAEAAAATYTDAGVVTAEAAALVAAKAEDVASAVAAGDVAIALKQGTVFVTKAGVALLTLAAPTAGTDDGKCLTVIDTTGNAHTVTTPANKLNGNKTTATFDGTVGSEVRFRAKGGVWYAATGNGVVIS